LQAELAGRLVYRRPVGGFFIWARLVGGQDAELLHEAARTHGVGFWPGARFSTQGGLRGWMRLCLPFRMKCSWLTGQPGWQR
jgi:DNA-binding transcriptional MocR family regulator